MSSLRRIFVFFFTLLLAAVAAVRGDAAAGGCGGPGRCGAVKVLTAAELADAVTAGAEHVIITEHLDLTSLPVVNVGQGRFANRSRTLFDSPQLQSLRVRSTMHATPHSAVRAHTASAQVRLGLVKHGGAHSDLQSPCMRGLHVCSACSPST